MVAHSTASWFFYFVRRDVQPEILDTLPETHPAAVGNRRDMRLLNRLMGNFRWIARVLHTARLPAQTTVVELAAGDGSLGRHLFQNVPGAPGWRCSGVDLCRRPDRWPATWDWEQSDLREAKSIPRAEVVIANHILHQLSDRELRSFADRFLNATRLLVINETARRPIHLWQARCAFLLGMNYVSRHDALVSVRAGFARDELPTLLGLTRNMWNWQAAPTALGSYRLLARRKEADS